MQTLIDFAIPIAMFLVALVIYKRISRELGPRDKSSAAEGSPAAEGQRPAPAGSLRAVVDIAACMGSKACIKACPENALGVVRGKAVLIEPARCVGHASCAPACPVGAISLVPGA